MAPIEHPFNEGVGKCDIPKCPFDGKPAIAYICGVDTCKKKIHIEHYNRRIFPNDGKPPLAPLPDNAAVCRRKHYTAVIKLANSSKKLNWSNNGKPETGRIRVKVMATLRRSE